MTEHSGGRPQFTTPHVVRTDESDAPTVHDCLWSYAFKDGKKRSVIIVNLALSRALPTVIKFPGTPEGKVISWQVDGESYLSNNDVETAKPQVTLERRELAGFKSGNSLTVSPASITTVVWSER